VEFRGRRGFTEAELDASMRHEVEGRDALSHSRGMVGRQLDDAVSEADVLRALARGA
jgi:hypothetical protein